MNSAPTTSTSTTALSVPSCPVFGYDLLGIDADDAKHLEKHAQKIEHAAAVIRKATVDAIMRIGEELSIARDRLANHKNGTFRRWVQQRCGLSNGTITNILAAYEQFADSKYLPTVGKYVDASAVYLLSSNSCPEEVFDEAMQRAESGEHITQKVVREMIRASAPNDEPDADNAGDDNRCWNAADCLLSVRREVMRWKSVCPKKEIRELADMLRQIAAEIETHGGSDDE